MLSPQYLKHLEAELLVERPSVSSPLETLRDTAELRAMLLDDPVWIEACFTLFATTIAWWDTKRLFILLWLESEDA